MINKDEDVVEREFHAEDLISLKAKVKFIKLREVTAKYFCDDPLDDVFSFVGIDGKEKERWKRKGKMEKKRNIVEVK